MRAFSTWEPARPLQRSFGPSGPEMQKESRKCLPGPPAPEPQKVSKKSRGQSRKSPESLRLQSVWRVFLECSGTFLETFWGAGAPAPGDIFETLSAFRARRARETSVCQWALSLCACPLGVGQPVEPVVRSGTGEVLSLT